MKKRWKLFCTALASVLVLAGCGSQTLKIGTGNVAGNYYSYGNVLGEAASKNAKELTVEVKETAGSAANLRLMKEGFLDLAIVQSDVLSDALKGEGVFEGKAYENVRVVAGLYTEQFQIVVPADSDMRELADLSGKRVSIGEKESGVSVVAAQVLKAAGLKESMMTISNLSFADSADALAKGQIDAFFLMAGAPTTAVSELAKDQEIRLISLDDRTIGYMLNLFDGYVETTVPADTYAGVSEETKTIGVKAVLAADKRVKNDIIEKLTGVLFENGSEIKYGTAVSEAPSLDFATKDLPGSFHDGAAAYYEKNSVSVETEEGTGRKHYIFGGQDE